MLNNHVFFFFLSSASGPEPISMDLPSDWNKVNLIVTSGSDPELYEKVEQKKIVQISGLSCLSVMK